MNNTLMYQNTKTIPLKNNAEDLKNWMGDTDVYTVDEVLEFLIERNLLNEQGQRVSHKFWELFIEVKE